MHYGSSAVAQPALTQQQAVTFRVLMLAVLAAFLCGAGTLRSQTDYATLQGSVQDPQGLMVPGIHVTATNVATSDARSAVSNQAGDFTFVGLKPGTYTLQAEGTGFATLTLPGLVLDTADRKSIVLKMRLGESVQAVTVEGADSAIQTQDAAVSTLIDQKEVANMPLNGRSLQDLFDLTPGVIQSGSGFSVNGGGTNSNAFIVDGVKLNSAPDNTGGFAGPNAAGVAPFTTVLGTTQALVPIDDLQEFRVVSSSYNAEFGGFNGGQFTFTTRSGTNQYHGSAFEYIRNTVFDANDWFNKYYSTPTNQLPRSVLHQNDFGGTFGGPVWIPKLYDGRKKTFFFFDEETLRLIQPITAAKGYVPDATMRAQTTGAVQQIMNAFPVSNVPNSNIGDGLALYLSSSYRAPSQFNSYNLRIDQVLSKNEVAFVRASNTPSSSVTNGLAQYNGVKDTARTYLAGLTSSFSPRVVNELRVAFTSGEGIQFGGISPGPGATPVNVAALSGFNTVGTGYYAGLDFYSSTNGEGFYVSSYSGFTTQRQLSLTDALSWSRGRHQFKYGFEFRRTTSTSQPEQPISVPYFFSEQEALSGVFALYTNNSYTPIFPGYLQYAAYAQDTWTVNPRLTLSYGLRWDLNPPPYARRGNAPLVFQDARNLTGLTFAPAGTPIYNTQYTAFAPRLGMAYEIHQEPRHETQLRVGVGLFNDAGTDDTNALSNYTGPGNSAGVTVWGPNPYGVPVSGIVTLPIPMQYRYPAITFPPTQPYTTAAYGFVPNLKVPYTIQANASLQQNFSANDAVTLAYVTSLGRKQPFNNWIPEQNLDPAAWNTYISLTDNAIRTNYNSAQVTYQHRVTNGLFAYAAYTWSHTLTDTQFNMITPLQYANSALDLRNNFNAVITWDIPVHTSHRLENAVLGHWGVDGRLILHGGFPINIYGISNQQSLLGTTKEKPATGVNYVPGVPVFLYGNYSTTQSNGLGIPGGRMFNPKAFTSAANDTQGDVPLNYYRGFGEHQVNMAVRRDFPIYEELHLQFRAEAFNVFNHPDFGSIDTYLPDQVSGTFGQATTLLSNSLGGQAAIYQNGGARNLQFALKLLF